MQSVVEINLAVTHRVGQEVCSGCSYLLCLPIFSLVLLFVYCLVSGWLWWLNSPFNDPEDSQYPLVICFVHRLTCQWGLTKVGRMWLLLPVYCQLGVLQWKTWMHGHTGSSSSVIPFSTLQGKLKGTLKNETQWLWLLQRKVRAGQAWTASTPHN